MAQVSTLSESASALNRGLIVEANDLSDSELIELILQPGFSTASQVTQMAGRGVGMDVVEVEIKHLGGSLQIESTPAGSRFIMRLPFTLSINRGHTRQGRRRELRNSPDKHRRCCPAGCRTLAGCLPTCRPASWSMLTRLSRYITCPSWSALPCIIRVVMAMSGSRLSSAGLVTPASRCMSMS